MKTTVMKTTDAHLEWPLVTDFYVVLLNRVALHPSRPVTSYLSKPDQ
jgi:hypothetical protein